MKLHRIGFAPTCLLFLTASLNAQLIHTWVSSTGNDSTGAGTPAKPYATFQAAVYNTVAGGIVSVLGPGDYGQINITQSITIDGTGGGSISFIGTRSNGVTLNLATPATVVLRNLTIDGGGAGQSAIIIDSTVATNIVNAVIDGCRLEGFTGTGISLGSESPMYVTIKNTTIQSGVFGVRVNENVTAPVTANSHVSLDHVTIQGATESGVLTANGNLDISDSNITQNVGTSAAGIVAEDYATLNVQNTMITSNTNGVCIYTNSTAIIGTSTVVADNGTNVEGCGGTVQGMGGAGPSPKL
jgi:hypothetical protein